MPAPDTILQKIQQFEDNILSYKAGTYNETQARHDFIDPLFEALGWDVNNTEGYAEAYREVVHEDAIKVEGKSKAPDYCFRIGGTRKFFVEAKKPAVNIKEGMDPAFQLRRYAWSAKLPLSVLTDFEEFAVYDCRIPPEKGDGPGVARIFYCTYKDFPAKWDEIAGIFAKTAILKGAFDRYVEDKKNKRGTAEVDAAFLNEIEKWRTVLAGSLAQRNPNLTARELNFAVQITIDRIIFLRICEDRGIEEYGRLQSLLKGKDLYTRLCEQFRDADERYNSGLFHFQKEKGRSEDTHDTLTPTLKIDDATLKAILDSLYYPAPYAFDVFPVDILGQVYERFLGKVIRLDAKHRAFVEEKPEVKKAGGVYYTPTYIVDYIVERTVGKALDGKTPKTASALKILDPACGSGSFLLGAYTRLLDWHLQTYLKDGAEKHAKGKEPKLYRSVTDEWKLTTAERRRILLNNLYGVDIDPQAVEVTKLSLLLKMLEGETQESINAQLSLSLGRVLPDLDRNIRCGNSLIGSDFYDGKQLTLLDEEEMYRVNVFDWHKAFPHILTGDTPGFDCVIGNPPYIRIQALKEFAPKEVEFYKTRYRSASKGNYDIYVVFIEKGLSLLNKQGRLGFITPSKFLTTDYGAPIRHLIADDNVLDFLVDFGHDLVFKDVSTYTCLVFLNKNRQVAEPSSYANVLTAELSTAHEIARNIATEEVGSSSWVFASDLGKSILGKLGKDSVTLLDLPVAFSRGSSSGADTIFCLLSSDGKTFTTKNGDSVEIEPEIVRSALYATDFNRYRFAPDIRNYIIYPYDVKDDGYKVMDEAKLRSDFPKAYTYLCKNRMALEQRKGYQYWYGYSAARNLNLHDKSAFLIPLLANKGSVARIDNKSRRFCVMASAGFSITLLLSDKAIHPNYVLGLLNSKLLFWNLQLISNIFRGGWITCTKQYVGTLPIKLINSNADHERHDALVELVERILDLTAKLANASPATRAVLQKQVEVTDAQIDRLVYELYGLTEEEIALVEGAK